MVAAVRTLTRAVAIILLIGVGSTVWYACSDRSSESVTAPAASPASGALEFQLALDVQRRHTDKLLDISGVVGTAIAVLPDGHIGLQVLTERAGIKGLPFMLDGVAVGTRVIGRLMVFSDPTKRQRPAPLGFSVGHPAITAGSIGARVRDATGHVYILSNNHVLANSNGATIGDPEYQPGPFDGGTAADQIATLSDFQLITFSTVANNTIDAAIALTTTSVLDNSTPALDAYGPPNSAMWGDADHDGLFDDRNALLGLNVQKYGRTTRLTHGSITGVNATVQICYEVSGFSCTKQARYVDQLIIEPGGFSGGGDSGSLIVTDDANLNPVALLFAGSSTVTIGNRIDLVLNRFGVTIDGFDPPPPGPFTDIAVTSVGAPASAVVGQATNVTVMVKNRGNQDVTSTFNVTLEDATDGVTVGTQSVAGLAVGATATVSFSWAPASTGDHTLIGGQGLADDRAGDDRMSVTLPVNPPLTDVAVTSVTAPGGVSQGKSANVVVKVGNVGNQPVTSSFVVTLQDTTAGVTVGSQTVAGLAAGATASFTFSYNATDAVLGDHVLRASHDLTDDDGTNNQRFKTITVNPKLVDIALTSITGPARVNQGDTAHIGATVQNIGERDVTDTFAVTVTDASAGGTIGSKLVPGLALGATATVDIPWNTATASITGHTLIATQMLPDGNATNNSRAIGVIVNPPVVTDVAITGMTVPAAVTQGTTATVGVSVQNVGQQNVTSSFTVTLTDATAGVTIGTQTVTSMAVGSGIMLNFNWNTTGAALGSHTLTAAHSLTDANATNNTRSATVSVNPKITDISVASVSAPPSVTQGNSANVNVTVQNVGQENVTTSFNVSLTDVTGGVSIGTQTVAALNVGASATLTFVWNTTGLATGSHTLTATHSLTDANAANNTRSTAVTVNPKSVDIALTSMTAVPSSVTQGDTVHVGTTIQNVGGQDITTGIDVVLRDATANVTIATQTVPGLVGGATATLDFPWNTAGVATAGHTLIATQMLPDNVSTNNSRAIGVTVNAPSVHVGNLAGVASSNGTTWNASVEVTVHDAKHNPVNGVLVQGSFGGTNTGQCVTGDTGGNGTCTITFALIPNSTALVSFAVSSLTCTGYVYKSASNHDPDGSSNGTTVFIRRP